jgi:hypothetical protein
MKQRPRWHAGCYPHCHDQRPSSQHPASHLPYLEGSYLTKGQRQRAVIAQMQTFCAR